MSQQPNASAKVGTETVRHRQVIPLHQPAYTARFDKVPPNRLRILWLSHFLPFPPRGQGALQRSSNLLRYLNRHADVKVLALEKCVVDGSAEEFKKELAKEFKQIEFFGDSWDLNPLKKSVALLSPLLTNQPYSTRVYTSKKLTDRAKQLLATENFDLLHIDTLGLAEGILNDQNCRTVLNHHNIESAMMRRRADKSSNPLVRIYLQREAALLQATEQRDCALVSLNIVVSQSDGEILRNIAPAANIAIASNSVDTEYFNSDKGFTDRNNLIFIGGLNWYANKDAAHYFIDNIWPVIRDRAPTLKVNFIGVDSQQLTNVAHNIVGTGSVPDVRNYLDAARVFVCPIRDGGGTRTKLLDAMASGIPIVSTTIGAEGLDAVAGEHILIADNPDDFAAAVIKLHEDRALWEKLSAVGKKFVRSNYSVEAVGTSLLNSYSSIS